MIKRGINIALLLISIGILFFIFNSFYSAFTKTPQVPSTEPAPSSPTMNATVVSGQIVGNTEVPAPEVINQNSSNEEAGKLLQENPALREALPPIPEAPTSTKSEETSNATATETSGMSTSTDPVNVESSTKPEAPYNNANHIVLPLNTSNSAAQVGTNDSFPKPVNNNENPTTANSSFPKPSSNIDADDNSNFPAPAHSKNN